MAAIKQFLAFLLSRLGSFFSGILHRIGLARATRVTDPRIEKIFVLMLENRSFDHMLGFLDAPGIDGVLDGNGQPKPACSNTYNRKVVRASGDAPATVNDDPPHEFPDILMQLCGSHAVPGPDGQYPAIDNSGFIDSYAGKPFQDPDTARRYPGKNPHQAQAPEDAMKCFSPAEAPILNTLAREYAVCDNWHASLPGPTWPNRFFVHAASSAGLDSSPGTVEMAEQTALGQSFENGHIYERLNEQDIPWQIFTGNYLPQSFCLSGMTTEWLLHGRFAMYDSFRERVSDPAYDARYTFIEPDWGRLVGNPKYVGGNSQHPLDGVANGEQLIREVYEAIRNSPHWEHSMLVITYDEHGGFFDHVPPPRDAIPPGDRTMPDGNQKYNFDFSVLGVRVPAVVISPWVAKGTVDHTRYDHSSIPATLSRQFGLAHLTRRDAHANDLLHLLSAPAPRLSPNEALTSLAHIDLPPEQQAGDIEPPAASAPIKGITHGFLNVAVLKHQAIVGHNTDREDFVHALKAHGARPHQLAADFSDELKGKHREIAQRYKSLQYEAEAHQYIQEVIELSHQHRAANRHLY